MNFLTRHLTDSPRTASRTTAESHRNGSALRGRLPCLSPLTTPTLSQGAGSHWVRSLRYIAVEHHWEARPERHRVFVERIPRLAPSIGLGIMGTPFPSLRHMPSGVVLAVARSQVQPTLAVAGVLSPSDGNTPDSHWPLLEAVGRVSLAPFPATRTFSCQRTEPPGDGPRARAPERRAGNRTPDPQPLYRAIGDD